MPPTRRALAATLTRDRDLVCCFATWPGFARIIPLFESVDELRWTGPTPAFAELGARFDKAVTAPGAGRRRYPDDGAGSSDPAWRGLKTAPYNPKFFRIF